MTESITRPEKNHQHTMINNIYQPYNFNIDKYLLTQALESRLKGLCIPF